MTTYDDNLLAARFAALAPEPLAGDWADVVKRAGVARRGRPRLRRFGLAGRRRRLVVVLAAVALLAVITATAIGGVRDFILDRGFVGLPPVGATPSTPASGELVVRYLGEGVTHDTTHVQAWEYADGRMIWSREGRPAARPIPEGANEFTSGYLEQRLTPEGVELLQSQVAELLERSRALVETLPADYDPIAELQAGRWGGLALFVAESWLAWGSLEVRDGDRLLRLQWQPGIGPHQSPKFEGTIATPEQLADLRRLDALLTDPASVLPSSAWAVRKVRAYVASHYEVCMYTSPPTDVSQLLSLLPAQAADLLRGTSLNEFEGDLGGGYSGRYATYCAKLTTEEARKVAEALSGLDPVPAAILAYQLTGRPWPEGGTEILFEPYFPHGQITCSVCG